MRLNQATWVILEHHVHLNVFESQLGCIIYLGRQTALFHGIFRHENLLSVLRFLSERMLRTDVCTISCLCMSLCIPPPSTARPTPSEFVLLPLLLEVTCRRRSVSLETG